MALEPGSRVVIAVGPARGVRGTISKLNVPMKPYGKRHQILADNGETHWFMDYTQGAFVAEDSPEGRAILEERAAQVGAPDLDADVAFAADVVREARTVDVDVAVERLVRHADERAILAHLDLVPLVAGPGQRAGKPPGWQPPALTAYVARAGDVDVIAPALDRLRRWFEDAAERPLCGVVARALAPAGDARLVDALRALTAIAPDPGVLAARLALRDPTVHADLAKQRVLEQDGRVELFVGGLTPADATAMVRALGERIEDVTHLNFIRASPVAYDGYDLDAWLEWPGLARFPRLELNETFRGPGALARVLASPHLSPHLEHLDLSGCDIGQKGCKALAASPRLTTLRSLHIDVADYDRTKWGPATLSALFPAGGALAGLEHLSVRGWKIQKRHLTELVASGRASLRRVQLDWNKKPLTFPAPTARLRP